MKFTLWAIFQFPYRPEDMAKDWILLHIAKQLLTVLTGIISSDISFVLICP